MPVREWKTLSTMWLILLLPVVSLAGCRWCHWGGFGVGDGTETPDTTAPTVSSTDPADAATDVAINRRVTASFSEAMDPTTITAATFTLTGPDETAVAGTRAFDVANNVATFTPTSNLAPGIEFTVTITTGVEDLAGNALVSDFVWTFTTAPGAPVPDTTAPLVNSTNPANAATGVVINTKITATFSEAMDPSTIAAATFTVAGPGTTPVSGNVTYAAVGRTATFTPAGNLAPSTSYTATITTAVQDLAGNALAVNKTWTFATAATSPSTDTTAPTVSSTSPTDGATGVAINQRIAATFSEAMNTSSIDGAFTVTGPGATPVTGMVAYDVTSNIATFTPDIDLTLNTVYTATITTDVKDLASNALANDFVWTFTTGVTPDTTAPLVNSTNPANAATGVVINTKITATFSEAMDPSTIAAATFTVAGPGTTPVSGNVTYAAVGSTATFTPAGNLAPNTSYTATITTAVQDLAGNALAVNRAWTFTTAATTDTVAPTVSSTNPAATATGVPINQKINATFSEAMDPLTISTAHYTVTGPGATSIAGTVSYDAASNVATFTPAGNLATNTAYTATLTTGARDLAGNALASAFVWSFTTGTTLAQAPVVLRSLSTFAAVAGAGLTNSNSGGQTTINGDVGLSPTGTCLGDGAPCSALNPLINGTLYANDPGGVAAAAKADLTLAYDDAFGRPPGTTVNDLSGLVLAPGVYTSGSTMSIAVGGTLTLDAQGDANAVWIFQVGSSLTVNNSAQVILINAAKASNVYWAIFASSTVGTNVTFKGNVLAGASNSLGTGSTVEGRMLCRTGAITLLSNTITTPAP